MIKEFRDFVTRGNVLELAVGIVIGAAFSTVVSSFVDDILMPPIGMALGGVDFSNLYIALDGNTYESLDAAMAAGAATINYGLFIMALINFLIVAFLLFLIIRQVNRFQREAEEAPAEPTTKACPYCLSEIDLNAVRCPFCTSELEAS